MKIVVSRYNEDIQWIDEFRKDVILYNKGDDVLNGSISLPNVGREGHTYFHYICENYDKLDDYTVFLQGNPFDHSPDICKQLRILQLGALDQFSFNMPPSGEEMNGLDRLLCTSSIRKGVQTPPSEGGILNEKGDTNCAISMCNDIKKRENIDFQYFHSEYHTYNLLHGCKYHWGLPISTVYEKLFEKPATDRDVFFGCGAQFIVSRDRILRRPCAFYKKIVDMLGYHYGPDEGYVIERMHPLIFGDE